MIGVLLKAGHTHHDVFWEYSRFEVSLYFAAALKQERNSQKRFAIACRAGVNADKNEFKKFIEDGEPRDGKLSGGFVEHLKRLEDMSKTGRIPKRRQVTPVLPPPPERG